MSKKKTELKFASPFLDTAEAAAFLKVKTCTIYAWIHQEKIPVRHHGRKPVFLVDDLKKWSDERNHPPTI